MPAKKTSAKRSRDGSCPSSVATESSADVAPDSCADACTGVCPMKEGCSPPVAPEPEPTVPAPDEPTGADDALENETEIVVEEKPAKKPRKPAKKKDAGESKPPKPPNAYMLFYQDELKKDAYTGIALPERAKMIGALWRQMDDTARAPFQERVAKAKEVLTPGA